MRRLSWIVMAAAIACSASTRPSADARAAAPTFSPPAGTYTAAQTVTISAATAGAVIHCTQDGSTPTDTSPACAGPLVVSSSTTVRAIATAAGHAPSAVASAAYTIDPGAEPAATPTFSPPAGTYTSAQTVTVSAATANAVIRCTVDGSTPTVTSPICAEPFVVSATTTVRAIATAPGHTPSAVASASYTMSAATVAEMLAAFSTKRTWFCHQSVGGNIYRGELTDDASGLGFIIGQHPSSGSTIGYIYLPDTADLAAIPPGRWAHSLADAPNRDPVGKVDSFVTSLGATFGGGLDYAGLKFCYSDAGTPELAQAAWEAYQPAMDALEAAFPGRLIYWTVPLTTYDWGNTQREWLSNQIRARYGWTGRVFDLADWQSRDATGTLVLDHNGQRILNLAWAQADEAHPNAAGANWIAQHYLEFMYGVELRAAASAAAPLP